MCELRNRDTSAPSPTVTRSSGKPMNLRTHPDAWTTETASIGEPLLRSEDPKLVRGEGRYTDDLQLDRQAFCVVVRSRVAHGVIRDIRTDAARKMPGVLAV